MLQFAKWLNYYRFISIIFMITLYIVSIRNVVITTKIVFFIIITIIIISFIIIIIIGFAVIMFNGIIATAITAVLFTIFFITSTIAIAIVYVLNFLRVPWYDGFNTLWQQTFHVHLRSAARSLTSIPGLPMVWPVDKGTLQRKPSNVRRIPP